MLNYLDLGLRCLAAVRYSDHHGEVVQLFRSLQIAEEDQLSWLEFWEELGESWLTHGVPIRGQAGPGP